MFRASLYSRVSTNDQQTHAMQNRAKRKYAGRRGWMIALQVREVGSGAAKREARERLLGPPPGQGKWLLEVRSCKTGDVQESNQKHSFLLLSCSIPDPLLLIPRKPSVTP
jgi:hypothetical protein